MDLTRLLQDARARAVALGVAAFVGLFVLTQFILPGDSGAARGTPMAIIFSGLSNGLAFSLLTVGLVVVYRTIRIINFAQAGLGVFGAYFCFELTQWTAVPFPISLIVGIALGAAVGVAFDLIFGRRFFNAPRIVLTVLTIVATTVATFTIGLRAASMPIFPNAEERTIEEAFGAIPLRPFLPFPGLSFRVGDLGLEFGFPEILAIELSIAVLVAVALFFRYTRLGVAVRALSENADRAALLGISVGAISTIVWGVSGALSATSGILIGNLSVPAAVFGLGASALSLFGPLAAAVIGRMTSIAVGVAATLWISIYAVAFTYSYPDLEAVNILVFLAIITIGLLVQRKRLGRSEESGGMSWEAVEELRPVPKELNRVPSVRLMRVGGIAIGIVLVLIWPFVVSEFLLELGSVVALQSIIFLSLVVLTGWAGQISLGQFGFAAVGGVLAASMTARVGIPFWFAVPIATIAAGLFAALVGIPALRVKGLFLAAPTLALAFALGAILFEERYFGWLLPKGGVDRPQLFLLDFTDNRSMYYLCVVCLVGAMLVVANLRRSRFGRLLIALRENEANVQAFGVSAVRMKITAFAISGALAGFAGAVFVHQQQGVSGGTFGGQASLDAFVFTVLGGISSPFGAVLGSILYFVFNQFRSDNQFLTLIIGTLQQGGGTLLVLAVAPAGLVSIFVRVRDSILRIIAQRRQIIVPSLFADYDPEALERRLIPLGENISGSGLEALGYASTFRIESELYGEDGILGPAPGATERPAYAAITAGSEVAADAGALTVEIATGTDPAPDHDEDGVLVGADREERP